MEREQIYFDLDRTLINTDQLVLDTRRKLANLGVNIEEEERLHQAYVDSLVSSTDFDPQEFIKYLTDQLSGDFQEKQLHEAFFRPEQYELNIYSDVLPTLDQLSLEGEILGVYSEGNNYWQQQKIKLSGLEKYFINGQQLIFSRKTTQESIGKLPQNAWVIDDNLEVIEALVAADHQLRPVWINRISTEVHQIAPTIFSLNAFLELLSKDKTQLDI